ncbi:hypothetical protein ElyMa_002102000 [Elysia marginata]|uniref:Uncharacterized protein n=1 Tax=Elysia marginata TaxID=1093978 RepID=A0AAV4FHB8_9GAST|nr:hypothetical protein ElyMa_002102000 [Elysia marginata]
MDSGTDGKLVKTSEVGTATEDPRFTELLLSTTTVFDTETTDEEILEGVDNAGNVVVDADIEASEQIKSLATKFTSLTKHTGLDTI